MKKSWVFQEKGVKWPSFSSRVRLLTSNGATFHPSWSCLILFLHLSRLVLYILLPSTLLHVLYILLPPPFPEISQTSLNLCDQSWFPAVREAPISKKCSFFEHCSKGLLPPPPFIWTFVLFCRGCFLNAFLSIWYNVPISPPNELPTFKMLYKCRF